MMTETAVEWSPQVRVVPALARVTLVALIAYSALAMALQLSINLVQLSAGPVNVYLFDLLLMPALLLLLVEAVSTHGRHMPAANRTVVFLVVGYCAYQIAVILPVSVIFHDLTLITVMRDVENRVALVLIPFVYLVGLKHTSAQRVVLLVNISAVILALFVMYRYGTVGPVDVQMGTTGGLRLRVLWGGATLLFAFLVVTSIFLARPSFVSYAAAGVGLVGITLTNHRSGYLALIVVLVPLVFHFRHASKRLVILLMLVALSTVLLLTASAAIRESTFYSLQTMLNPSADRNAIDRVDRFKLGLDYFMANPLGDFAWSHRRYLVKLGRGDFEPHNFVAQILSEQGIVGFAFVAAICFTLMAIAWRNRVDRMSAVMLACLVFYLVFCLFNTNILNVWNIMLLAVPAGLILDRHSALAEQASPEPHATQDLRPDSN